MQIYPEKYDKLVLSTSERSFLRTTERAFAEDELAYYVVQINPRKRDAGQGKAELFNMIIVPEGIMLLRFFDVDIPLVASTTIKALANPLVYSVLENDIRSKLEESNYLVRESGNLRFALNISFVFPNIDFSQMEPELTEPENSSWTIIRQFLSKKLHYHRWIAPFNLIDLIIGKLISLIGLIKVIS